jgi:hypothetical protein
MPKSIQGLLTQSKYNKRNDNSDVEQVMEMLFSTWAMLTQKRGQPKRSI